MKIKFYSPEQLDKNLKATVHKTGKLGFTIDAAKKLELSENKSISIGRNEEDVTDDDLYVIVNEGKQQGSFNVNKAGDYYYISTKALFDNFGWDYSKFAISFDITPIEYDGQKLYRFKKRQKAKKEY